jgi:plasmid stability protein
MGQILVRNLDDELIAALKLRAELAGKSLEQTVRELLSAAAPLTSEEKVAVSRRLRAAFAAEEWDTAAAIRWGRDDEFFELEGKFDSP